MSADAVSTSLSRIAWPFAPRAISDRERAQRSDASELLEQLQASGRGEGTREEDTRGLRKPPPEGPVQIRAAPPGVSYPPAAPSLPPPLIPIRELPPPPAPDWLIAIDLERALEEGVEPVPQPTVASDGETQPAERDAAGAGPDAAREPSAAGEQALFRLVLARAADADPLPQVDTSQAGRFVDERV